MEKRAKVCEVDEAGRREGKGGGGNDSQVCLWMELPDPRAMEEQAWERGDLDLGSLIYLWDTHVRSPR